MELAIFRIMNKLLIISILLSAVLFAFFLGLFSLVDKEESYSEDSRTIEGIERNGVLSYLLLVPLFVGPAAVSGIIASFFKTVKLQIMIWVIMTFVFWISIMIFALLLLTDPTSFGIPENYWDL